MSLFSVEGGTYHRWFGRWIPNGCHVWIGPFGLHLTVLARSLEVALGFLPVVQVVPLAA